MLDNEIVLNHFLLGMFEQLTNDFPTDEMSRSFSGHGHSPIWIAGHLAIVGEMGCQILGGEIRHQAWLSLFGPRSEDLPEKLSHVDPTDCLTAVAPAYAELRELSQSASAEHLNAPHDVGILKNSPLKTNEHIIAHLLTTHLAFHLAQWSACRRELGQPKLF
ncbi:DinB family protein [Thalassoroseus pseudoceratinae]|uniref:DinB family protein n=1 Tax=Thalassoroseus pseudoceratinae TaxID=2713176 RepID=UPI00141F9A42|nr:DinB family protein [Thalassoroseus pseudoceratinae]